MSQAIAYWYAVQVVIALQISQSIFKVA